MPISKPKKIAGDPELEALWSQLTDGANLSERDAPALGLLCLWYSIAAAAEAEIEGADGHLQVLDAIAMKPFKGDDGEPVPLYRKAPALSVLKEASSEIRALSEQLGITGKRQAAPGKKPGTPNGQLLNLVFADREDRAKKAGNQ